MKQKVSSQFRAAESGRLSQSAARDADCGEVFASDIYFVDVTGANPGLGAEERGQAEAIARNLREMARLQVPIITTITGEGGSGGALAIAVSDRVLMMENAIYSVISPEGCASIMWRDSAKKELAAEALRITSSDLKQLGCIDDVVPEPEGGAHTDPDAAAKLLDVALRILPELEEPAGKVRFRRGMTSSGRWRALRAQWSGAPTQSLRVALVRHRGSKTKVRWSFPPSCSRIGTFALLIVHATTQ